MSLDITKLENVQEFPDKIIARCPACAEEGHDNKGNHLVIFPSGKYGCVVYPKDPEHRRQIMRIAGGQSHRRQIRTVRPARPFVVATHPDLERWKKHRKNC